MNGKRARAARGSLDVRALEESVRSCSGAPSLFRDLIVHDTVESTNDLARQLAGTAVSGTWVCAGQQRSGKGRWGRPWVSEPGGLYLSGILKAESIPSACLSVLPLVVGVALARAVEDVSGRLPRLKWPNDLLWGERKLGGILCESSFRGSEMEAVVIGIGLNVNQEFNGADARTEGVATSLRLECGTFYEMPVVLGALVHHLSEALLEWLHRDWAREAYWRLLGKPEGREVRVVPKEGNPFLASILGVHDDGGLIVRIESGGERLLVAEEIEFIRTVGSVSRNGSSEPLAE